MLHIIINDKGEHIDFVITQANVDHTAPLKERNFLKNILGSLYGDKGYLSKKLTPMLFDQGLHLVTDIRNNMKNVKMTTSDKRMLRKRSVIETINDQLNNIVQAQHSRYRSFGDFITNLDASLIAYSFQEEKPDIKLETESTTQLGLCC